ncbi:MAG TPA: hypothetical protein VK563_04690 [Puia sp.]|nr:hypothetical protein [Puia sp.]
MNRFFKTVLLTGLFVGTTDIVSAFLTVYVKTGKFAPQMFNYIAGGALGLDTAIQGGNAAAFLGLFFHYFICFAFTLFFFWMFKRVRFLSFNKYLVGMLYAVFVNVVMEQLILRLTPLPVKPFILANSFISWVILGVLFGIPIAYNAYAYYGAEKN